MTIELSALFFAVMFVWLFSGNWRKGLRVGSLRDGEHDHEPGSDRGKKEFRFQSRCLSFHKFGLFELLVLKFAYPST